MKRQSFPVPPAAWGSANTKGLKMTQEMKGLGDLETDPKKTLGEICYEGFSQSAGERLPWAELPEPIRDAWQTAGETVVMNIFPALGLRLEVIRKK